MHATSAAYPRVRGDHRVRCGRLGATRAYPRVRGDHASTRCTASAWSAAYPRVRGDHRSSRSVPPRVTGLPPRARGSHGHAARPRTRHGLPPRARGSPRPHDGCVAWPRPTPACAGITRADAARCARPGLPPRARGSPSASPRMRLSAGLPPRARGSPLRQPAAGHVPVGLPPRARGSRTVRAGLRVERPTPACAGITQRSTSCRSRARPTPACAGITRRWPRPVHGPAYPRVRGDHSSASTRGVREHRPTPACAGITPSDVER